MTQSALLRVLFSASNLNGFAAACLSYSLGSLPGTLLFVFAALIGCVNKYHALTTQKSFQNLLMRRLSDPSITAQVLMGAALINAVMAGWQFMTFSEPVLYYAALTCAWTFGVLGDDALRRNDKTNFANLFQSKGRPVWLRVFLLTTRNPIFYYFFVNFFFALALFFSGGNNEKGILLLTALIILSTISGIIYCVFKAFQFLTGAIQKSRMNGIEISLISNAVNMMLAFSAYMQDFHWMVLAQIIFLMANLSLYFETRSALDKEQI